MSKKLLKNWEIQGNLAKKFVLSPNKEKRTKRHTGAFILMAYVRTYPLDSLLNLVEYFCHPLPNELDHCAEVKKNQN